MARNIDDDCRVMFEHSKCEITTFATTYFNSSLFFPDKQHLPLALLITSTTSHGNKLYPVHLFLYYNETEKDKRMPETEESHIHVY
jgi:hypothetical protein